MQKFVNDAMYGKLTFQCADDRSFAYGYCVRKNDELINTYIDEIDWDNDYVEKYNGEIMNNKLESRIARLEKLLSKNYTKNEQMFGVEDIKLAIKDTYNALVFLHNALDDEGSPKADTVENMLNELQYVADNWKINVGAY